MIGWLVIGVALGLGAKFLDGGLDLFGWLFTLVVGMSGAALAGWLTSQILGWADRDGYYALFAAFSGGLMVLWVVNILAPNKHY